ncbi:hypothetical protein OIV83_001461 [Microbotryomycetes sp. JL201]|nr:hypothetical protein OIV83_001461 [Microbotryomycetes sp. JL201]
MHKCATLLSLAALAATASAQTFKRTGACPNLGCVWPPDQTEFIAGQVFDIRVEVQAPQNGSMPFNNGVPSPDFSLSIGMSESDLKPATDFFGLPESETEDYSFKYFEDLFARDAGNATVVNALSRSYRYIALYQPGDYYVKLSYNGGMETVAKWSVKPLAESRKAKNVVLFIGDGMTTSMITAARLLGHKSINGKYQSQLTMDGAEGYGSQMSHSIDSYITDSANSATALYSGKKATVNGLNIYTDSDRNAFSGPKFETIFEMGRRVHGSKIGIVTTATVSDATPAAVCAHTTQRSQSDAIVDQFLNGVTSNYSWTKWDGPEVLFGGGAIDFLPRESNSNVSKIDKFAAAGYQVVHDKTSLQKLDVTQRALGLFTSGNMATWLDRNVFKKNLDTYKAWDGSAGTPDQPGLKDMTLKAIEILSTRAKNWGVNWMLMSEAASIDKQMHALDYDRALGELLEFDATIRATLDYLKEIGQDQETLVVVTADHGHGFDVFGSTDVEYLRAQATNATKRGAIGIYAESGLSAYQVAAGSLPSNNTVVVGPQGPGFPVQWDPRYPAAMGTVADVDRYEDYGVRESPRKAAVETEEDSGEYMANPEDSVGGFFVSGNLPIEEAQGVHSLTDVPVYAWGPGHELFAKPGMNSPDIAFKIAQALDIGKSSNVSYWGW